MKNFINIHPHQSVLTHCRQIVMRIVTGLGIIVLGAISSRADEYSNAVVSLRPVGFWPLNETSGTTAFDVSGNNNNGAYQSAVTLGGAGVPNPPFVGFASGSVAAGFNSSQGNNSCVTLTNLPINANTVTITEWIYPTVSGDVGTTFWNNGQGAGFTGYYFNNAQLGYNWPGGGGNQWTYGAFTPPINQWSFVALVITPTNAVFYMGNTNGVLSSEINNEGNSPANFTTGTAIGGPNNGSTTGFNGSMSDVAVFNYSLTPAQITQLYVGGYGGLSVPSAPTGLSIAAGNAQVSIGWSPVQGATGYNVKRSTTSGSETKITSLSGTVYHDTGLVNGTTYYYEISATNSAGEGNNSVEVSAIPSSSITSYSAGVLALGPVGFWPLNETSGKTAFDASGNGYNGTYQSNVALGGAGVPNPPFTGFAGGGRAAGFNSSDGNNSCVTLANLPIDTNTVTITEWIYPTVSSDIGTTFWNNSAGAGITGYYFNSAQLGYNWPPGANQWTFGAFFPPADVWSFVALVITPTNAVYYLGNASGLSSVIDTETENPANFTTGTAIGGPDNGSTTGFNGSLSDVAVFNASLTPAQVTQLFADSGGYDLPPAITTQPVSHDAYTNGTASFSVTAIGAAPLSYQWFKGASPISGQTSATLTISNIQSSAGGNYSVVIANSFGSVTSVVVTLTLAAPPIAYENLVLAANPIGYWPLDLNVDTSQNASGQNLATDLSGNGNMGTYNGISAANEVPGPSPFICNGVNFNGVGGFVNLSTGTNTSVLNFSGPMAMEAWVQPANAQTQANADIFAKGWDFGIDETEMSVVNSDSFVSSSTVNSSTPGLASGGTVTTNWTHLVTTWDGNNWNLYVNGELVGAEADTTSPSLNSDPWAIGNGTVDGNGRYFTGNICQVALYTNALTPSQIVAHYAMGLYGTTNLAPVIAVQPVNQRVTTNTTATFTVVAVASPLPTYQWYSIIGGITNLIADATNSTYTTSPVQDSDTGSGYFVVVSNSVGSASSEVAILTAGHIVTASGFLTANEYFLDYPNTLAAFGALYPMASSLPAPNKVEYLKIFNDNADLPTGGGERIYGWFTPPVTGNYIFFEASDDAAALWLSTNSAPANAYQIAQNEAYMISGSDGPTDWTLTDTNSGEEAYSSTGEWRSDQFELGGGQNAYANLTGVWTAWPGLNADGSIPLKAGSQYYIELDHWQNAGGQGAAVTYKLDGNPDPGTGSASLLTGAAISDSVPDSVAPAPQPHISKIRLAGSKVIASGNNGLVNAVYSVLTSTNLTAPFNSWTVLGTQRFDSSGNFAFTNSVTTGAPQKFYLIEAPSN